MNWRFPLSFVLILSLNLTLQGAPTCDYSKIPTLNLESILKEAASKPNSVVKLPDGVFRIPPKGVNVHGAKSLTIEGAKTTLVLTQFQEHGITFEHCQGITLKGITIDYDILPFTQGTIIAKSSDNSSIDVEIQDGYPDLTKDHNLPRIHFFDGKTLGWKQGIAEGWSKNVQFITPRKVKIILRDDIVQSGQTSLLQIGDMVAFTVRMGHALQFFISRDIRVEDLLIFSSPSLALGARNCDGDNYFRYKVERGPRPTAAKVPRLLSTNADGFNYGYSRKGPVLEGCEFSFMADDGVNLHGPALQVLRKEEPNVVWCLRRTSADSIKRFYEDILLPGDPVRILAADNFTIKKTVKISKIEFDQIPPFTLTREEIVRAHPSVNYPKDKYMCITLSDTSNINQGDLLDFPSANSNGYVIRGNKITDLRTRGLCIMSSNGIIEDNTISRVARPAIRLGYHYNIYREGGWLHDVVVRNNTIEDVGLGYEISSVRETCPSAISVCSEIGTYSQPETLYASEHRNIQIINNRIKNCTSEGIITSGLIDGKISGNIISNCNTASPKEAMDNGRVPRGYAITVMNSKNLKVENNEFKNASTTKEPVFIAP